MLQGKVERVRSVDYSMWIMWRNDKQQQQQENIWLWKFSGIPIIFTCNSTSLSRFLPKQTLGLFQVTIVKFVVRINYQQQQQFAIRWRVGSTCCRKWFEFPLVVALPTSRIILREKGKKNPNKTPVPLHSLNWHSHRFNFSHCVSLARSSSVEEEIILRQQKGQSEEKIDFQSFFSHINYNINDQKKRKKRKVRDISGLTWALPAVLCRSWMKVLQIRENWTHNKAKRLKRKRKFVHKKFMAIKQHGMKQQWKFTHKKISQLSVAESSSRMESLRTSRDI